MPLLRLRECLDDQCARRMPPAIRRATCALPALARARTLARMNTPATLQFQPVIDMKGALPAPAEWRPPQEGIVSGDPAQRAWDLYASADGRFHAGIWECAVGKWRVVFTESEFCQILAGEIVVSGADGSEPIW